jgi:hypothetical protein
MIVYIVERKIKPGLNEEMFILANDDEDFLRQAIELEREHPRWK